MYHLFTCAVSAFTVCLSAQQTRPPLVLAKPGQAMLHHTFTIIIKLEIPSTDKHACTLNTYVNCCSEILLGTSNFQCQIRSNDRPSDVG